MADKTENAMRFLNAYASIEHSLNVMLHKNDYVPFKKLVHLAAKNNRIVAKHEETLSEYADLRNAIVHQRSKTEEIIAEPIDSVTADIERIAELLDEDENILAYVTAPVTTADETTTVREAYSLLHDIQGDKLPVYENGQYLGLVTMDQIAGWLLAGNAPEEPVKKLINEDGPDAVFMGRRQSIMEAVLFFDSSVNDFLFAPVILVTETGDRNESPLGILSTHDLSRILAALV
ncbi:MAG: CBS domain-containing protein [Solobacterium sp.]|nr:CBS domain-containing protein [Solobacterium sp.]